VLKKHIQLENDANVNSINDVINKAEEEHLKENDNKTKCRQNKVLPPPITTDM
jgi:hypothetical protein